jgi:hypothetical protein
VYIGNGSEQRPPPPSGLRPTTAHRKPTSGRKSAEEEEEEEEEGPSPAGADGRQLRRRRRHRAHSRNRRHGHGHGQPTSAEPPPGPGPPERESSHHRGQRASGGDGSHSRQGERAKSRSDGERALLSSRRRKHSGDEPRHEPPHGRRGEGPLEGESDPDRRSSPAREVLHDTHTLLPARYLDSVCV